MRKERSAERPKGLLHDEQAVTFVKALLARGYTFADVQQSWDAIEMAYFSDLDRWGDLEADHA